jgi:hypothetical protein
VSSIVAVATDEAPAVVVTTDESDDAIAEAIVGTLVSADVTALVISDREDGGTIAVPVGGMSDDEADEEVEGNDVTAGSELCVSSSPVCGPVGSSSCGKAAGKIPI